MAHDPVVSQTIDDITFELPPGFKLEKVAAEPLVKWPVVCDWDSAGNLLVVESGGVGRPIEEHNQLKVHRIIRLVDRDGDGVFDERQLVVDKLPFTEGVLAYRDSIYACAPPQILKFTDSDQDGSFEQREVWFDGTTITGCANDLHGPYLGRDGWIYWCKGAFAAQQHRYLDGRMFESRAAHVFRRHWTGGDVEPVATGGMDNPVELAVNRAGERFFTSTFLHHPHNGLRDGIAHAVYGGVYGKDHDVFAGHYRTGELMPVMTDLGPAAPSGLLCLRRPDVVPAPEDGREYLVAALFNLQKVTLHKLIPSGASYTTEETTLLKGDRIDFHPTDVLEDADGSLLIVDTGGWYNLCCPTSKIDQQTAAGGVYRLSKSGTPIRADANNSLPDQLTVDTSATDLAELIHDRRPWLARSAVETIANLDGAAAATVVQLLSQQLQNREWPSPKRLDALWALGQSRHADALPIITDALQSDDSQLVQAACQILSLHRVGDSRPSLENLLKSPSLAIRRTAAEAIGRIGHAASVQPLLQALQDSENKLASSDRILQHSVIYALIEIGDADAIFHDLRSGRPTSAELLAGLIALDQLGQSANIETDLFAAALNAGQDGIAAGAAKLLAKHRHRAAEFQQWLTGQIRQRNAADQVSPAARVLLQAWKDTAPVQSLVVAAINDAIVVSAKQQLSGLAGLTTLFTSIDGYAPVDQTDEALAELLTQLSTDDAADVDAILSTLDLKEASQTRAAMIHRAEACPDTTHALRLIAWLPEPAEVSQAKLQTRLVDSLLSDNEDLAGLATSALPNVRISSSTAQRLVREAALFPPRTLSVAIEAVSRVGDDGLDQQLVRSLRELPAARTLNLDQFENLYRGRSSSLRDEVGQTVAILRQPSADIEASVTEKLAQLGHGDAAKGMQLFRSSKATCSACHRVGYVGGEIGPELSRIGASRTRAALLEAVMFPNARLEQSYQSTTVLTVDGEVYTGLIRHQGDSRVVEMQLSADKTISISKDEIESMQPSSVSVMPAGLDKLLSDEEIADLLAFLQSAR